MRWSRSGTDVKKAFVNASLKKCLYVSQPEGFVKPGYENQVYFFEKALYGLRQASREWHTYLNNFLIEETECEKNNADPRLYLSKRDSSFMFLVVYVDDIMLMSSSSTAADDVIRSFSEKFEIRVTKGTDRFLGATVQDNGNSVELHTDPTVKHILEFFQMSSCNPVSAPLPAGLDLTVDAGKSLSDQTPYRQLLGALMHFANTV